MDDKAKIREYVKDRDAALLSLDKDKILQFMRKYAVPCPKNDTVFWAMVHKCICHINSATDDQKQASAKWLRDHGLTTDV